MWEITIDFSMGNLFSGCGTSWVISATHSIFPEKLDVNYNKIIVSCKKHNIPVPTELIHVLTNKLVREVWLERHKAIGEPLE